MHQLNKIFQLQDDVKTFLEAKAILASVDHDGDGNISFEELLEVG